MWLWLPVVKMKTSSAIKVLVGKTRAVYKDICLYVTIYSWASLIWTCFFRIPHYFELKIISPGFSLQSFTDGYFKRPLFWTTYYSFPACEFEIVGFNSMFQKTVIYHWLLKHHLSFAFAAWHFSCRLLTSSLSCRICESRSCTRLLKSPSFSFLRQLFSIRSFSFSVLYSSLILIRSSWFWLSTKNLFSRTVYFLASLCKAVSISSRCFLSSLVSSSKEVDFFRDSSALCFRMHISSHCWSMRERRSPFSDKSSFDKALSFSKFAFISSGKSTLSNWK